MMRHSGKASKFVGIKNNTLLHNKLSTLTQALLMADTEHQRCIAQTYTKLRKSNSPALLRLSMNSSKPFSFNQRCRECFSSCSEMKTCFWYHSKELTKRTRNTSVLLSLTTVPTISIANAILTMLTLVISTKTCTRLHYERRRYSMLKRVTRENSLPHGPTSSKTSRLASLRYGVQNIPWGSGYKNHRKPVEARRSLQISQ